MELARQSAVAAHRVCTAIELPNRERLKGWDFRDRNYLCRVGGRRLQKWEIGIPVKEIAVSRLEIAARESPSECCDSGN